MRELYRQIAILSDVQQLDMKSAVWKYCRPKRFIPDYQQGKRLTSFCSRSSQFPTYGTRDQRDMSAGLLIYTAPLPV